MNILSYGAPGPPNPGATILLKALFEKFSAEGDESERILNHTESAFGITAKFGTAGTGAGITRLQAGAVFRRIWGLTIVHDAIGIEKCEIEMGGGWLWRNLSWSIGLRRTWELIGYLRFEFSSQLISSFLS